MPPDTVITVRGRSASRHAPERATVRLAGAVEGPDQAVVHRTAVQAANTLVDTVRALAEPDGPVERWSNDRLHTWFDRPWDPETGRQRLAPVCHARATLQLTFRDLAAIGAFLDDVGVRPGVVVEDLAWHLVEEHERDLARAARRHAVADAAERARDYAEAAGLSTVAFVAVADTGLLDDDASATGRRGKAAVALGMAAMESGGLEFSPADIEVTAEVEARFLAN